MVKRIDFRTIRALTKRRQQEQAGQLRLPAPSPKPPDHPATRVKDYPQRG